MRTLTLRIYLTVVAVLLLFAFASAWVFQRQMNSERVRVEAAIQERMAAWGELIQRSLPPPDAPDDLQASVLGEWSQRLRVPLALDAVDGRRVGASESFQRRLAEGHARAVAVRLDDGRTLWVMRTAFRGPGGLMRPPGEGGGPPPLRPPRGFFDLPFSPPGWPPGLGLVAVLVVLFVAVAAGAWPVVGGLTKRLRALKQGVEVFGTGQLSHRVEVAGRDEVAAVASSFNQAAERIEALVRANKSLLANASHELRSPLARMKMAVSMLDAAATPEQRQRLKQEIDTNVAELDALVEEVLFSSRLDSQTTLDQREAVDLLGLAAEEAARTGALVQGVPAVAFGDERLLRRALRNLLENAAKYGGEEVGVETLREGDDAVVRVCDRGPGVPAAQRERIFEPFYRMPGHAEATGGVGLGLALVRQIAERHGGRVRCTARDGGGSCFELRLPTQR